MHSLRRILQFGLGLEALALMASFLTVLSSIALVAQNAADPQAVQSMIGWMLGVACIWPAMAVVPGVAWWGLRKHKSWARGWAIAASVFNLFLLFSGIRTWMRFGKLHTWPVWLLAGVMGMLGLAAFWSKDVARAGRPKLRIVGDSTSKFKDYTSQAVSVAIVWLSLALWSRWGSHHGLVYPSLIPFLIQMELAVLLSTFGHELGHLFAGWAGGKALRSFHVGPFLWRIRNGAWTFAFDLKKFYGGSVGMVAPDLKNVRSRKAFSLLGGPVASLTMGSIFIVATLATPGHSWERYWMFLALLATFSISAFIVNLIPLKPESLYSDGAQLVQVMTNGPWARVHFAFAMVTASLVSAARPRNWNVKAIDRAAEVVPHGERGLLLRLFACMHYLDADRIPEALKSLEKAEALWEGSKFERPEDICAEFVFVNAFYKRDLAAAELWWQRIRAVHKIEKDGDYWRAKSALLWLRGDRYEAREAWEMGNELAEKLPSAGSYDFTRSCFARLGDALEAPASVRNVAPVVEWVA